jgi:hypothetical protein
MPEIVSVKKVTLENHGFTKATGANSSTKALEFAPV